MRCFINVHVLLLLSGTERFVDISWQARTERSAIGIVSRFGAGVSVRSSPRVVSLFSESDSSDCEEDLSDAELMRGVFATVEVDSSPGTPKKRALSAVPDESSRPVRRNRRTA